MTYAGLAVCSHVQTAYKPMSVFNAGNGPYHKERDRGSQIGFVSKSTTVAENSEDSGQPAHRCAG